MSAARPFRPTAATSPAPSSLWATAGRCSSCARRYTACAASDDFQAELNCPRTVLSGRLKTLTEAGLLERRSYQETGKRSRPEYVLTDMGAELRAALVALTQWGDQYLSGGDPAPISFVDEETRSPVRAGFVDADGRSVAPDELRVVLRR